MSGTNTTVQSLIGLHQLPVGKRNARFRSCEQDITFFHELNATIIHYNLKINRMKDRSLRRRRIRCMFAGVVLIQIFKNKTERRCGVDSCTIHTTNANKFEFKFTCKQKRATAVQLKHKQPHQQKGVLNEDSTVAQGSLVVVCAPC